MKIRLPLVLLCVAAALSACGDSPTDVRYGRLITAAESDTLFGIAGLYQYAAAVRVTDAAGEPLEDVVVEWSADAGELASPTSVTNAWGEARAWWRLGSTPGLQHLVARVADAEEVTLTARAEAADRLGVRDEVGVRSGDTAYVSVRAYAADGRWQFADPSLLAWEPADPSVVEALPDGVLVARAPGASDVTVRLGAVSAQTRVVVDPPWTRFTVVYRGHVSPDTVLEPTLHVRDAYSNYVVPPADSVEWESSSAAVAVAADGRLTTLRAGTATIVGRYAGLEDSAVVRVRDPVRVVDVAPLGNRSCVDADDGLRCWSSLIGPRQVALPHPLGDLAGVRLGGTFACGLEADGAAVCRREPDVGQVAPGTPGVDTVATPVAGGRRFTALAVGSGHACGLDSSGGVHCWGRNDAGQLGSPSAEWCDGTACSSTPLAVDLGGRRAVQVAAGPEGTCALLDDGSVTCWGDVNGDGSSTAPTPLPGSTRFRHIGLGRAHGCGLSVGGEAFCWGANPRGQLGDGSQDDSDTPVRVADPAAFDALSVGDQHACALTSGGEAYCWGDHSQGQLGYGSQDERFRDVPTPVLTGLRFTAIGAGDIISCGAVADGRLFCWGQAYSIGNPGAQGSAGCALGPHNVFPCIPYPSDPVLAGLPEDAV